MPWGGFVFAARGFAPALRSLRSICIHTRASTRATGGESGKAAPPEAYRLELYTRANPDRWLKTIKRVTLRIDGRDFEAPIADSRVLDELKAPAGAGRNKTTGGVLARDERLVITLSPDLAERLGRAQRLALILPQAELELGREHIAMIEALRLRANQRAADPADTND